MKKAKRATSDLNKDKLNVPHGSCGVFGARKHNSRQVFSGNANQARIKTCHEVRNEARIAGHRSNFLTYQLTENSKQDSQY